MSHLLPVPSFQLLQYPGWIKAFYPRLLDNLRTAVVNWCGQTLSANVIFVQLCVCKMPSCHLSVSASGLLRRRELWLVSAARCNVAGIQLVSALMLHSKLTQISMSYFAMKCSCNTLLRPLKTNMFFQHCQDGPLNWENTSRRCFLWELAFPSVVGNTPYIFLQNRPNVSRHSLDFEWQCIFKPLIEPPPIPRRNEFSFGWCWADQC